MKQSTKIGIDSAIRATMSDTLSKILPLRSAAIVPMMIASVNSMPIAITARRPVTGSVSARTSDTGRPEYVTPRFPWKTPVM